MNENDKQAEPVAFYGLGSQLYGMDGRPVKFPLGTQFYTHPAQPVRPALQGDPHIDRFKSAWIEWSYKTEWVQEKKDWPFNALGMHRADVMKKYIDHLEAQIQAQPVQPAGCAISQISSRMCEWGTRGCVVEHEAQPAGAEDLAVYKRIADSYTEASAAEINEPAMNWKPLDAHSQSGRTVLLANLEAESMRDDNNVPFVFSDYWHQYRDNGCWESWNELFDEQPTHYCEIATAEPPAAAINERVTKYNLPPLPKPAEPSNGGQCCGNFTSGGEYLGQSETICCGQFEEVLPDYYTAAQMWAYARAAIAEAEKAKGGV